MRLLVLSDCHGDQGSLMAAIEAQPSAKTILFLGDGIGDIEKMEEIYKNRIFISVAGNCDLGSIEPTTRLLVFEGKRLMMTHGHEYRVKFGIREAACTARRNECDLLLYGHTHQPVSTYEDGLHILNPGSVRRCNSHTYATVDITPGGIFCNIVSL